MKQKMLVVLLFFISILFALDSVTVQFYGKMHRKPDANSPIITMVDHGNVVKVIAEEDNWVEVQHNGYRGWLLKEQTTLAGTTPSQVSPESQSNLAKNPEIENEPYLILILSGGLVTLLFMVGIFFFVKGRRKSTLRQDMTMETQAIDHQKNARFHVLIFSKKDKSVGSTISNIHKRLSSCFRELGFDVMFSPALKKAELDLPYQPNVIVIDAKMERNYIKQVEKLFEKYSYPDNLPVIIYNVESPAAADPGHILEAPYFLGTQFTDQDIMRITGEVLKPVEEQNPEILSGIITGDGLYEIMQLIELSTKNGLLQIKNDNNQLCGEIGFEKGMVVVARTAKSQGEQAAIELAASKRGSFAFKARQFRQKNCFMQPTAIMLNAMKVQDEQSNYTLTN